jgi:putative holliday junction resolvase
VIGDSAMNDPFPQQGRLAGIDYGTVRIGIAVSDGSQQLATPLAVYARRNETADAEYFRHLVESESIVGFVVGLPVHASGDESQKSLEARQFGQWLKVQTGRPVTYFDERYTSAEAERLLQGAGQRRRARKQRRDMVAAQIILASFLEASTPSRRASPGPLADGDR